MEIYATENQQVEAIRDFIANNKKILMFSLVLVVCVIVGGKFWRQNVQRQSNRASDLYQEMLIADHKRDIQALGAKGQVLMQGFSRTPYPQLAALLLAKNAVLENKFDKAEELLRWVLAEKKSKSFTAEIATERLARILQQRGDLDAALLLLTKSKPSSAYITIYEEAIGDIYLAKGQPDQAQTAYKKALQHVPIGVQAPILQIKLMELGVADPAAQLEQGDQDA